MWKPITEVLLILPSHLFPSIFAVEDWQLWTAGLTGAIPSLGVGIAWFLTWLNQRRRTTLEEWQEIVRRQDAHIEEQRQQIEEYRRRENSCHQAIYYLHGLVGRMCDDMKRASIQAPEVKPIEDFLPPDLEQRIRQVQQNTALVKAEARRVMDTPTTPQSGSGNPVK